MHQFSFAIATLCFILSGIKISLSENCSSYTSLTDYRRSANYTPTPGDDLLCDYALSSSTWYRFTSAVGGEIPNYCISEFTCGTHQPIWMDGEHPSVADGVVHRDACAIANNPASCCGWTDTIEVRNCGDFYIYKLARPPGCYYAYCAGNASICDGPGMDDCVEPYPTMSDDPTMEGPIIEDGGFYFQCNIDYTESRMDAVFEVQWLFDYRTDDTLNSTILDVNNTLSTKIYSHDLTYEAGRLGKILTCRVRSYSTNSDKSPWLQSNAYFAGIRMRVEDSHRLSEDSGPEVIQVEFTLPIVCTDNNECLLTLYLSNEDDVAVLDVEDCRLTWYPEDWDPDKRNARKTYRALALRDNILDGDRIVSIGFEPIEEPLNEDLHMWRGYEVEAEEIQTNDKDARQCRSYGDPHYRTFDETEYDYYGIGEFVFVKSYKRQFEVQTRITECGTYGKASCNCGMAAMENNDVVVIDFCEAFKPGTTSPTESVPKINIRSNELSPGTQLRMSEQGDIFFVYFFSGAWVKVHLYDWGMDTVVHVPSDDYGNTGGLCGTFDSDSNNDFRKPDGTYLPYTPGDPDEFSESWSVAKGENLFEDDIKYNSSVHNAKSCRCLGGDRSMNYCGHRAHVTNQPTHGIDVGELFLPSNGSDGDSFYYDYINEDLDFNWNSKFKADIPGWPTPSGITEQIASDSCTAAMQSTQFATSCETKTPVRIDHFVSECIFDVKIIDGDDMLPSTVNAFQDVCSETAVRDVTLYDPSGPPADIVSVVCPNGCHGNGICVDNVCVCDAGYIAQDCSIVEDAQPIVFGLKWDGLCNINAKPCQTVFVVGSGFLNSASLTCHILNENTQEENTVPAVLLNFREAACPLWVSAVELGTTPAETSTILITNDGIEFTNGWKFTVFDSVCIECTTGGLCEKKKESCLIEDCCYANGEIHPYNDSFICSPSQNEYGWTPLEDYDGGEDASIVPIVVLVALFSIVIIICIGVALICRMKHIKKLSTCVSPGSPTPSYQNWQNDSSITMT